MPSIRLLLGCLRDGLGMFAEAYTLFAVGNISGLFAAAYPTCWTSGSHGGGSNSGGSSSGGSNSVAASVDCAPDLIRSMTYLEITGVVCGMVGIGIAGDVFGRRKAAITTAGIMTIGCFCLAGATGPTLQSMFLMYVLSLFFFGVGVGGEYPIASANAAEKAEAACKAKQNVEMEPLSSAEEEAHQQDIPLTVMDTNARSIRGMRVVLTFSMQGVGNWVNTAVILLLMIIFGVTNTNSNDQTVVNDTASLEAVWRTQHLLGAVFLLVLLIYRVARMPESEAWLERKARRQKDSRSSSSSSSREDGEKSESDFSAEMVEEEGQKAKGQVYGVFFRNYWHRLLGSSLGWLVWDVTFYGNKLFQGKFIAIIHPGASPFQIIQWTLINSTVALTGYYVAAFTIDRPWMGRMRMQNMGFFVTFVIFTLCGAIRDTLVTPEYVGAFQTLYLLSSFFGQWGPNATTWLIPSEIFPTDMRTLSHGLSAAAGKLGALLAGVVFAYVDDKAKFYLSGACGLIGMMVTYLFVPDVTTLSLDENDRYWESVLAREGYGSKGSSAAEGYDGPYTAKENLSVWERWRGVGRSSDGGRTRLE